MALEPLSEEHIAHYNADVQCVEDSISDWLDTDGPREDCAAEIVDRLFHRWFGRDYSLNVPTYESRV